MNFEEVALEKHSSGLCAAEPYYQIQTLTALAALVLKFSSSSFNLFRHLNRLKMRALNCISA